MNNWRLWPLFVMTVSLFVVTAVEPIWFIPAFVGWICVACISFSIPDDPRPSVGRRRRTRGRW